MFKKCKGNCKKNVNKAFYTTCCATQHKYLLTLITEVFFGPFIGPHSRKLLTQPAVADGQDLYQISYKISLTSLLAHSRRSN